MLGYEKGVFDQANGPNKKVCFFAKRDQRYSLKINEFEMNTSLMHRREPWGFLHACFICNATCHLWSITILRIPGEEKCEKKKNYAWNPSNYNSALLEES